MEDKTWAIVLRVVLILIALNTLCMSIIYDRQQRINKLIKEYLDLLCEKLKEVENGR